MSVYLLKNSDEPIFNFIICTVKIDSPWFYLCWSLGRPFEEKIPEPIQYFADKDGELEDYPVTNADQFLVSEKVLNLIETSGSKFDNYKSEIIFPQGKRVKNYYTINFTESMAALDWKKSIYEKDPDLPPSKVKYVKKLVVKSTSIPKEAYIFRLKEFEPYILITEKFKDQMIDLQLSGFKFINVELS